MLTDELVADFRAQAEQTLSAPASDGAEALQELRGRIAQLSDRLRRAAEIEMAYFVKAQGQEG
jgi:hypothetical protein